MQVTLAKAESNSRGGRIDLSWSNPAAPGFQGVRIFRREGTFPGSGDIVIGNEIHNDPAPPAGSRGEFADTGLRSETTYYYAIVAYDATPTLEPVLVSALATSAYETAAHLYSNLPVLYQRFDTVKEPVPAIAGFDLADKDKGQLLRFVEMFGLQFDLLRSFASAMQSFADVERVDGSRLLPKLAEWINWNTDHALSIAKQRNEVKYAPHFYRTVGIAANLHATINRLTTRDAQLKEFVHNIFASNDPEQLALWELERDQVGWQSARLVTLDVAYEGRPAPVQARDTRQWLFYHARQSIPKPRPAQTRARLQPSAGEKQAVIRPVEDHWQVGFKINDRDEWLESRQVTFTGQINKHPAALQRNDPTDPTDLNFWLFYSAQPEPGPPALPAIHLKILAAGRRDLPAQARGRLVAALVDGDVFRIRVDGGAQREITVRAEHFADIANATADEIAAHLDAELPGVDVRVAEDSSIVFTSQSRGVTSSLEFPVSAVRTKLGLAAGTFFGSDPVAAEVFGRAAGPFAVDTKSLVLRVDDGPERTIAFSLPGNASAAQVAAAINTIFPGVAQVSAGRIRLVSTRPGEASLIIVDVNTSSAAAILGLGSPLAPAPFPAPEVEPATCEDSNGNIWLFWSSPREGVWKIWYNRFDGAQWSIPKALTTGLDADREPAVAFRGGRITVFWSRKKTNGLWNIFLRTTTNLDFATHNNAVWTERELSPIPVDYDNREPAPHAIGVNRIELFFSSNRADGWHIWSKTLGAAPASSDVQITTGQFTKRAPAVLILPNLNLRLWFRSNESQSYRSEVFANAETTDARYSGSTSVDTRNPAKLGLHRDLQDTQRYTYHNWKPEREVTSGLEEAAGPTGAIAGKVEDASSAVVPGARITIVHQGTGAVRSMTTNLSGNYDFPLLAVGGYTLKVEKEGFQTFVQRNLLLQADQNLSIPVTMIPGEITLYARDTVGIYYSPVTGDPNPLLIESRVRGFLPIQVRAVLVERVFQEVYSSLTDTFI